MKTFIIALVSTLVLTACAQNDASVASHNISQDADNFKIDRRIVFYDSIQGEFLLSIEGRCSINKDNQDNQLEVTCKSSENEYKKHFLGISDNVTYFAEQLKSADVSIYHYKVVLKPSTIIPNIEVR